MPQAASARPAGVTESTGIGTADRLMSHNLTKVCKKRLVPAKVTGVRLMIKADNTPRAFPGQIAGSRVDLIGLGGFESNAFY